MRYTMGVLLLCALVVPAFAAKPSAPVALRIDGGEVVISNVSSGDRVVLLGVTENNEYMLPSVRRFFLVLNDDDRDGVVVYKPKGGTPYRSIFVAVDLATGSTAVAGRTDAAIKQVAFPNGSLKKNAEGLVEALGARRRELGMVVVRPGTGAWLLDVSDGEQNDADKQKNGVLDIAFATATPLDVSFGEAPKHLKKDDVVAAIDPGQLEVFATALDQ